MQIYLTINLINNKMYIGKNKKPDPKYLGSGFILKRAIKKYGRKNFKKIIIEDNIDNINELNIKEKFYIKLFNASTNTNFYNISNGGDGGDNYTNHPNKKEIRLKMIRNRKPTLFTDEIRKRMSDSQKKEIYKFDKTGKYICKYESLEDAAIKNNIKNKGNITSVAQCKRNYAGGFRWSYTDTPNKLFPLQKTGRKLGTKNSYKIKRNHTNIKTFEIIIYDKDMNFIKKVLGYKEAAEYTNLSEQMVSKKCRSKKLYKGYHFIKGNKIFKTIKNEK